MNIYEKLNEARLKFHEGGVKKSGENSFSHYTYFQLKDIISKTNQICKELKMACLISFDMQLATLSVVDCEKPEDKILFTSPMSRASLKGCHDVQNLGAVESYLRRYLYMTAFEIAECDPIEDLDNGSSQIGESTSEVKKENPSTSNSRAEAAKPISQFSIRDFINQFGQQIQQMKCKDGSSYLDTLIQVDEINDPETVQYHLNYLNSVFNKGGNK